MKSVLHIAWFVLAGLVLLGNLSVIQYVWFQGMAPEFAVSRLPGVLATILMTLGFGAAYLLIAKTAQLMVPLVFGWLQLIAHALAQVAGICAFYLQYHLLVARDTTEMSDLAFASGAQLIFFAISALLFFAAMLSAAVTTATRPAIGDLD